MLEDFTAASQNSNERSNLFSFSFSVDNLKRTDLSKSFKNVVILRTFNCTISISSRFSQSLMTCSPCADMVHVSMSSKNICGHFEEYVATDTDTQSSQARSTVHSNCVVLLYKCIYFFWCSSIQSVPRACEVIHQIVERN